MEGRTRRIKPQNTKKKAQILEDERRDYLNELPEPLVNHIISYFTMKDVVRMSVVAKRWRYVWLSVPCLNFSPMKMPKSREIGFINRSLLLHKGSKIQKMSISFRYEKAGANHVDSWIQFGLTRNVDELHLDLNRWAKWLSIPSLKYYKLPLFIFNSTSLKVLTLIRCIISFPVNFKLSSLKILSLERVYFSSGSTFDLISCPNLVYLSLTNCETLGNIDVLIMHVGMKTLKIHESDSYSSSSLEVYAPFVVSFELVTRMTWKNYDLKRMRSLQRANFDCEQLHGCYGQLYFEDKGYAVVKILEEVDYVKDLRLCCCYIQALSIREVQSLDFDSLSFGVTGLRIRTGLTKWELPGISYMLRHSPKIETLIINIDKVDENGTSSCSSKDGEYWMEQGPYFIGLLGNLKTVKIYNFMKNLSAVETNHTTTTTEEFLERLQSDMSFLRFLLKNSKVLERMIITSCKNVKSFWNSETKKLKLLLQLTQELLVFPRASRDAEISFS